MRKSKRVLFAVCLLLVSLLAYATEVSFPHLTLKKTYLKSRTDDLSVTSVPSDAFKATSVTCPGIVSCVFQIQVFTQVEGLVPGDPNDFAVIVNVDGLGANVLPNSALGFDSTSTGGGANVRAFTWITKRLSPGTHSVTVQFFVPQSGGSAQSPDRTLAISVLQ